MKDTTSHQYRLVPYDNFPLPQTNPSRLHALAMMAGVNAPPIETCRVLELGASEGANLIPMAHRLPHAEFIGVDLEPEPVERGRAAAHEFGLRNLRLEAMDLLDIDASFGTFDYVIAHGVYSWTPENVSDKVLAIMGELLSPNGIGFVSYNTQPAGHIRTMVREMMQFHSRAAEDPIEKLAKAREFLAILARERSQTELDRMDAYDAVLAAHATELLTRTASSLMHDELSTTHRPASLTDFAAHARRHGLQYLDDAASPDPRDGEAVKGLDVRTAAQVRAMAAGDRLAELQYHDFLRMRRFRQSLVCRTEVDLAAPWAAANAVGLHASTPLTETETGTFVAKSGFRISTTHPLPLAYLRRLAALWPESEPVSTSDCNVAAALFRAGANELHGAPSRAARAGDRPRVDDLVLLQLKRGNSAVSTLLHEPLQTDEEMRNLLPLLDGTRTCAELALSLDWNVETTKGQVDELAGLGVFTSGTR